MAGEQLPHLVKMANQIARNLGGDSAPAQAAEQAGNHLRRFWTPAMREQLLAYHRAGGADLSPAAARAIELAAAGPG